MLIFAIVFFSGIGGRGGHAPPGIFIAFMVVWFVALVGIIIYHVSNAVRPDGVPTQIIETDSEGENSRPVAERLEELEDLRSRKLVSDAEYEVKRQEILKDV
jgi:hypothetical protein